MTTANYTDLFKIQKRHFQATVKNSSANDRIEKLVRMAGWIKDHHQDIRNALYKDFKKPEPEVDLTEIKPILAAIDQVKSNLKGWMKDKHVKANMQFLGTSAKIMYEAKGVVLIISPWNFPFMLCLEPLVAAIAAGCCVVLKPSEMTPNTALLLEQMIGDLFEEDEVAVRLGDAEVAKELLTLKFNHIFFTGSPKIGSLVMQAAAKNLSSVTLELGGQNPVIIDESADLKDAAEKLVWGKFLNTGQSCMSPNYVYVHRSIQDYFLVELKKAFERMFSLNDAAMEHNSDFGRIVNRMHFNRVKALIQDSVKAGAEVVFGGKMKAADNYISPTVLNNVPEDAPVLHNEIFGPVLPILPYDDIDDVIEHINLKDHPLAVYVFTKSDKQADRVISQTSSGTVCINDTTIPFAHPNLPFGGVNTSGIGKGHGYYGFLAFSNERAVVKQRIGLTSLKLMYPPYTEKVKQTLQLVMKWL